MEISIGEVNHRMTIDIDEMMNTANLQIRSTDSGMIVGRINLRIEKAISAAHEGKFLFVRL